MTRFSNILEAVAVPVIGLDSSLRVVTANKVARWVFSDSDQISDIDSVISKNRGFRKALHKTLETGQETNTSVTLMEGFKTEFLATIRAVATSDGVNDTCLVVTFEDRSTLRDVKAMRSDFVANVSHEIRSPLTTISGFVETLQGSARDDPEARGLFLKLMDKEVTHMTNLVRDLLSLSRVEVKERRAPKKIVDPNQIIKQAEETATAFAAKHGKTLVVKTDATLPNIRGNQNDLVQVLISLLENAVTYSSEGEVIHMCAEADYRLCCTTQPEGVLPLSPDGLILRDGFEECQAR